ncbi:MAG: DUF4350 domain-containing protein [Rhodoglobus sp.]
MSDNAVITPRIRTTITRALFWIIAVIFLITVALVSLTVAGAAGERPRLDPESPQESGTRALTEVLGAQGVDVIVTTTLEETKKVLATTGESSLFLTDPDGFLSDTQMGEAVGLASTVVVTEPGVATLLAIAPDVANAGTRVGTVTADCSLAVTTNAATITAGPSSLRIIANGSDAGASACYGSEDLGYGLIALDRDGSQLVLLGATNALTNGAISSQDNAAFALRLLGQHDTLVWYTPSLLDASGTAAPQSLDQLSPGWVLPAVWLAILTLIAAALSRGRRFGPLVVEKLPVTVRSSETMHGRARLYEKSAARLHTLDALRIGTLRRLSAVCGMARTASVEDIINRVGPLIECPLESLRHLLIDSVPHSDHELIALSDELLALEKRVTETIRPTNPTPPTATPPASKKKRIQR